MVDICAHPDLVIKLERVKPNKTFYYHVDSEVLDRKAPALIQSLEDQRLMSRLTSILTSEIEDPSSESWPELVLEDDHPSALKLALDILHENKGDNYYGTHGKLKFQLFLDFALLAKKYDLTGAFRSEAYYWFSAISNEKLLQPGNENYLVIASIFELEDGLARTMNLLASRMVIHPKTEKPVFWVGGEYKELDERVPWWPVVGKCPASVIMTIDFLPSNSIPHEEI